MASCAWKWQAKRKATDAVVVGPALRLLRAQQAARNGAQQGTLSWPGTLSRPNDAPVGLGQWFASADRAPNLGNSARAEPPRKHARQERGRCDDRGSDAVTDDGHGDRHRHKSRHRSRDRSDDGRKHGHQDEHGDRYKGRSKDRSKARASGTKDDGGSKEKHRHHGSLEEAKERDGDNVVQGGGARSTDQSTAKADAPVARAGPAEVCTKLVRPANTLDDDIRRCSAQPRVAAPTQTFEDQLRALCKQTQANAKGLARPSKTRTKAKGAAPVTQVYRPVAPVLQLVSASSAPVSSSFSGSSRPALVQGTAGQKKRVLPTLFFNAPALTTLLETFVPGAECPLHCLITGQSGTGKSWTIAAVSKYWAECTSAAHVFTTEDFETAVTTGVPLPTDPYMLLALDDADSMGPKALACLKGLLAKKTTGSRLLLAITDAYREPRHRFLLGAAHKTQLYRTTFAGPLRQFVKTLRLSPAPPDAFVNRAIALCGGNLIRLVNMLKAHRAEKTLVAASTDDVNVWQEERLFRAGKLDGPPSEKCALMVCFNACDNGPPPDFGDDAVDLAVLGVLAQLYDRYSASLLHRDPWLFHVADLPLPGQRHDMPTLYFHLTSKQAHLKTFLPQMTRFFQAWGCSAANVSSVTERMDAFRAHWFLHEKRLRRDQVETTRLFTVTGTDAGFLRTLDEMMSARQAAMKPRPQLLLDTASPTSRKFLLG